MSDKKTLNQPLGTTPDGDVPKKFETLVDKVPGAAGTVVSDKWKALDVRPHWSWHWAYMIGVTVFRFFIGPKSEKEKDNSFVVTAQGLISSNPGDETNNYKLDCARKILEQHRLIENTMARRRLEKWACWVISVYLLFTLLILVACGVMSIIFTDKVKVVPFISDTVLTVLLSTTTLNVLGLVVIVLRGHFPKSNESLAIEET